MPDSYCVKRVRIQAIGTPAPKGSGRAMLAGQKKNASGERVGGKAVFVPSGSKQNEMELKDWRSDVIQACMRVKRPEMHPVPLFHPEEPLAVAIIYRIPMRRTDLRSDLLTPKPGVKALSAHGRDPDKLNRATLDAITQSQRIWIDDSRAAAPMAARLYVQPGNWYGAEILIGLDELEVCRWYYDQLKGAREGMKKAAEQGHPAAPQQGLFK